MDQVAKTIIHSAGRDWYTDEALESVTARFHKRPALMEIWVLFDPTNEDGQTIYFNTDQITAIMANDDYKETADDVAN